MMKQENLITALRRMAQKKEPLICQGCGYEHNCSLHGCAVLNAAADRLTELSAPPPNPPLTLEELREMDGEPVWVEGYGIGCYDIFCGISTDGMVQFYLPALPADSYGKTWLAYRRKSEEDKNETTDNR